MATATITGLVYKIGETEQISETFKKRTVVVEDISSPDYPQFIKCELKQDKVNLLDNLVLGQEITAHININGRKYNDKQGVEQVFVSLDCCKIDLQASGTTATPAPVDINSTAEEDQSDLPF